MEKKSIVTKQFLQQGHLTLRRCLLQVSADFVDPAINYGRPSSYLVQSVQHQYSNHERAHYYITCENYINLAHLYAK